MLGSASRPAAHFGGWLAAASGAWFVLGGLIGRTWIGMQMTTGTPVGGPARSAAEQIGFYTGLGVVIVLLAAMAIGRFSVISVRDAKLATADEPDVVEEERPRAADHRTHRWLAPVRADARDDQGRGHRHRRRRASGNGRQELTPAGRVGDLPAPAARPPRPPALRTQPAGDATRRAPGYRLALIRIGAAGPRPLLLVPFWKPPKSTDKAIKTMISTRITSRQPPALLRGRHRRRDRTRRTRRLRKP